MLDIYREIERVGMVSASCYQACRDHWDNLTKPLNSLGMLEEAISRIGAITETEDVRIDQKVIVAMCADNGIIEEGVTQTGSEITALVTEHIASGIANVNLMAQYACADVIAVDIGVKDPVSHPAIWNRHIANGTKNFLKEPAMSMEETEKAIAVGIQIAGKLAKEGYQIIGLGEMGIGNTTTSSALVSCFLGLPVKVTVGPGAGLSSVGVERKKAVVENGLALYEEYRNDPVKILSCLGGLDIAGLVGVMIGAANHHIPVVLDGFISQAAALTAVRICPNVGQYLLASHVSSEPASLAVLEDLGLTAIIHAEMSLGEGTGAVALFPLLDMALSIYGFNQSFADSGMEAYQHLD